MACGHCSSCCTTVNIHLFPGCVFVFNVEEVRTCLQVMLMIEVEKFHEKGKSGKTQKSRVIKGMRRQRNELYILKSKEEVSA